MQEEYNVKLSYSEIHLILKALDDFVEENRPSVQFTIVESIQEKLEPIHHQHIFAHREKLFSTSKEESFHEPTWFEEMQNEGELPTDEALCEELLDRYSTAIFSQRIVFSKTVSI